MNRLFLACFGLVTFAVVTGLFLSAPPKHLSTRKQISIVSETGEPLESLFSGAERNPRYSKLKARTF